MNKIYVISRSVRRFSLAPVLILAMLITILPTAVQAAPASSSNQSIEASYSSQTYYVRRGDTLAKIALRFGVSWRAIAKANGIANANRIYSGQRLYIPSGGGHSGGYTGGHSGGYSGGHQSNCAAYYKVRRGDTLSQIARNKGISTYSLANANGITNYNHIYVGQRLCVPSGGGYGYGHGSGYGSGYGHNYYTVRRGDTLAKIARWHGTSAYRLTHLNGLSNPNHIYVGQGLRIK